MNFMKKIQDMAQDMIKEAKKDAEFEKKLRGKEKEVMKKEREKQRLKLAKKKIQIIAEATEKHMKEKYNDKPTGDTGKVITDTLNAVFGSTEKQQQENVAKVKSKTKQKPIDILDDSYLMKV